MKFAVICSNHPAAVNGWQGTIGHGDAEITGKGDG